MRGSFKNEAVDAAGRTAFELLIPLIRSSLILPIRDLTRTCLPSPHNGPTSAQVEVVDAAGHVDFEPLILFTHRDPSPARPPPYLRFTLVPVPGSGPGLPSPGRASGAATR